MERTTFIFGLLFPKRCSDVFDAEREKIVGRRASIPCATTRDIKTWFDALAYSHKDLW